jgi:methylglyoxal synthase
VIEFNLSVPRQIRHEIISMRADKFRIITSSPMGGDKQYFLIEADEEDMLIFKLKYGSENVWKR